MMMRNKNMKTLSWMAGMVLGVGMLLAACAPVAPAATSTGAEAAAPAAAPAAAEPRVMFTNVEDGATITTPFTVTMGAENFTVIAAGEPKPGEGHLHIMVDAPCVEVGQGIPKDETHLHYGAGQLEAGLTLAPGEHTLCLQAADGTHVALDGAGMQQMIKVTVQ